MTKNNFYGVILSIIMATIMTTVGGCKKDDPSSLSVSIENISISADGGKQSVSVISNTSWSVSGNTSWCYANPSNGNGNSSFEIIVEQNKATDRECSLIVQTNDGSISKLVRVVQSALDIKLSVNPNKISFGSQKADKKTLQITCNSEWSISNLPDWLDADQLAGNGDRSVIFTTTSENATANPRTANITVNAGSSEINVDLIQAAGLSECYIKPEGIVTIWDGVAFLSVKHGDVKNYRAGIIRASDYNKYSQKELLEITRAFNAITVFDRVESINNLQANTDYFLLTLAYDHNDQEGELIKTSFTTKPNDYSEAYVAIGDDVYYNDSNEITWYAYPDGATDKYYTMFLSGLSESELIDLLYVMNNELYFDSAKLAWYLDNEIQKGSQNYKTKKGDAEIIETSGYTLDRNSVVKRGNAFQLGYSIFVTWGVNISNNKLSGIVKVSNIYVEYNSSSRKKILKSINKFQGKKVNSSRK